MLALFCFAAAGLTAQIHVTGFVADSVSGEKLIGGNIVETGTVNGAVSDNSGYFSLWIKTPTKIRISYIGYRPLEIHIGRDTLLEARMMPVSELEEVVIAGIRGSRPGMVALSNRELLSIPALGGKPDVLKAAQLLPGIKSQNEGSSLLMVRGGNPGENLYLLDNVSLIYVNHLGGFMSVFNPDMINGLEIYKGGFPAMYGGKLSSVVDIAQKEGNMSGLKGTFSVGITDLSFSVEGPAKLKNTSFIIAGRKTLTEALLGLASGLSDAGNSIMMYGFHDVNAKFSWKPDSRNSLHLNLYQGDDYLHYHTGKNSHTGKSRMNNIWGNWLVSARWRCIPASKLYSVHSISYNRYRLVDRKRYDSMDGEFTSEYLSSVKDASFHSDWKYPALNNWTLHFGVQASLLTHEPNRTRQSNLAAQKPDEKLRASESSVYLENRFNFFNHITVHVGGRAVYYASGGFSNNSLEPRLQLNVNITKGQSLNLSYMSVSQNSHLIFTAGGIMNNEVWVPAGSKFPEAVSKQYSAGWTGSFYNGMFQAEFDVYYKQTGSLSTYKEGYTSLMGDTDWQSKIITGGRGEAGGIELLVRKTAGKNTGFASYSWSKTTRRYPDINGGMEYTFEYDRPHAISLSFNRQLNDKWTFSAAWLFMTGLPYTPAVGRQLLSYEDDNDYLEAMIYGERNSARMRPYHRLDIGFNYTKTTRRNRKAVWTFSVYNAYNRHNPYFYYYNENSTSEMFQPGFYDERNHSMSLYQASFFPLIPAVSYKLYFDRNVQKRYRENQPEKERKSFSEKLKKYLYMED
jgi:hypothetical protein